MFRLENLLNGGNGYYRVWDNEPGGTVVAAYSIDGIEYLDVIFEQTPNKIYTYLKESNG